MEKRGRGRPPKVKPEQVEDVEKSVDDAIIIEDQVVNDDADTIIANFNPLQEEVVQRDYATPSLADEGVDDIEEPTFAPPNYESILEDEQKEEQEENHNNSKEDKGGSATKGFHNAAREEVVVNPIMSEMSQKDKQKSAEAMVDMVLNAYEGLHSVAQKWVQVSDDELVQMQMNEDIDLSEEVPLADGNYLNVGTFFNNYNEQVEEALEFDSKFKQEVRPYMIRVFPKKGWGFSDEQYLMYMFGQDALLKITMLVQLKSTLSASIKMFAEARKEKYGEAPPPVQEPIIPSQNEIQKDDDDLEDDELNEVITESDENVLDEEQEVNDVMVEKLELPEASVLGQDNPPKDDRPDNVTVTEK